MLFATAVTNGRSQTDRCEAAAATCHNATFFPYTTTTSATTTAGAHKHTSRVLIVNGPRLVMRVLAAHPLTLCPQPPVQLYTEQLESTPLSTLVTIFLLLRLLMTLLQEFVGSVLELFNRHDGCCPYLNLLLTA